MNAMQAQPARPSRSSLHRPQTLGLQRERLKNQSTKEKSPESKRRQGIFLCGGVADGTRTHDNQNHNLGLYQLSYSHRRSRLRSYYVFTQFSFWLGGFFCLRCFGWGLGRVTQLVLTLECLGIGGCFGLANECTKLPLGFQKLFG
jgi:hypothetical protein